MKFTTLIPMRFNDGREVPQEQIDRMIDESTLRFGGCSDEGAITTVFRFSKCLWMTSKKR